MKYHFIINPVAGKADSSKELVPKIRQAAKACGIRKNDLEIQLTNRPSHAHFLAMQAAKKAAEAGEEIRIYAAGGDGTFNEVLTGAMPYENAAVGLLPYGSGNDFLRNFGEREEFCDLEDQLRGGIKVIDMIQTQRGYAATICAAGLDAKVGYGIPKYRRLPLCSGGMAYKLSILEALMGKKSTRLSINVDGHIIEEDCLLVAICNGHTYGGGFMAAPESKLDDGILDVYVVRAIPLLKIAKVLPLYQAGKHFVDGHVIPELEDIVQYFPARKVDIKVLPPDRSIITVVDGEGGPEKRLTAEVVPLAARVILPGKVFERL